MIKAGKLGWGAGAGKKQGWGRAGVGAEQCVRLGGGAEQEQNGQQKKQGRRCAEGGGGNGVVG